MKVKVQYNNNIFEESLIQWNETEILMLITIILKDSEHIIYDYTEMKEGKSYLVKTSAGRFIVEKL